MSQVHGFRFSKKNIAFHSGSAEAALTHLPDPSGLSSLFTSLPSVLADQVAIGDACISPEGCKASADDIFHVLYGEQSQFMLQFQARRKGTEVDWKPPNISEEGHGGYASLKCRIPLPVVGLKAYEETLRFVFCHEETIIAGRVVPALVVHLVGVINGGMAVGKIRSEQISYFWQDEETGLARMRVIIKKPPGRFSDSAVSGSKVAFEDFRVEALTIFTAWAAEKRALESRPQDDQAEQTDAAGVDDPVPKVEAEQAAAVGVDNPVSKVEEGSTLESRLAPNGSTAAVKVDVRSVSKCSVTDGSHQKAANVVLPLPVHERQAQALQCSSYSKDFAGDDDEVIDHAHYEAETPSVDASCCLVICYWQLP